MGGEVGRARGEWLRRAEEEVGNKRGEAKGVEGKGEDSGVQEGGVHLQEWVAAAVKPSQRCHHFLTTDVTDGQEGNIS